MSSGKSEDETDQNVRVFAHPRLLIAFIVTVTAVVVGITIAFGWGHFL